jgi:hypothetical protein
MKYLIASAALIVNVSSHAVDMAKDTAAVASCTVIGQVSSTPPYILPGADIRQMKRLADAMHADTLFVVSRGVVSKGVAYRCKAD